MLWSALVALLLVAQTLLVLLTLRYEEARAQERVEELAAATQGEVRRRMQQLLQELQGLQQHGGEGGSWGSLAGSLLRKHPELSRVEQRDRQGQMVDAVNSPFREPLFDHWPRSATDFDTGQACSQARRVRAPSFANSQFVPLAHGLGMEVMDVCIPVQQAGQLVGFTVASISLVELLDAVRAGEQARHHEILFVEADGTRLARTGTVRGAGVFIAERVVDLPGQKLQLKVDSSVGSPRLIPNLAVALVLGLSVALSVVVVLLARDVRRRASAEAALAEALAFRKAMEDSLITGLRARDARGRITYVNPAFCEMVGFAAAELVGQTVPLYWPPELVDEYSRRQPARLGAERSAQASHEGFETTFMRRSGERFAVLIFEAPLVDTHGRHTGWMSAVLDVSAQKRVEELARQQQERLQATARLATVGEMASLLSHELNQPLAAIASYAAGSLNLLKDASVDKESAQMLQHAAQRIAEQAERAGRVIKSVHDFVRRREQAREAIGADVLIDAVLPLVRLQARKSGTRVEVDMPGPPPRVVCDRTMLEQVLLNLTRNGIQAMEGHTDAAQRELRISVQQTDARWVRFHVADRGPGIAADVVQRLFTPFFTTRSEGMGLGLSLCRTVIEQHGGALDFENLPGAAGTEFRFTLPCATRDLGKRPAPSDARTPSAEMIR